MKITAILILAACLHVSAAGYSQKVTLNEKNASLEKIFRSIHKQTGFQFLYNDEAMKAAKPVTIEVNDAPLDEVLLLCFKDQPLEYSLANNAIVVKQKPTVVVLTPNSINDFPPPIDISGRVTDKEGHPLQGASITVKGKKLGTTTDANGVFILKGLSADDEITISFTEYSSQTFKIGTRTNFVISLEHSDNPLDEVQIIAYGKTSQRLSTGNISSVQAETIAKQPVSNPLLALQGQMPGLFINQSNGIPGGGVSVRVQGQNSIGQGNDPLYVVDGVPYPSTPFPPLNSIQAEGGRSGNGGNPGASPLAFINPDDIESITLLKDADATSIYGSRAANGALLITTKKGKAGVTRITLNLQNGWGNDTRRVDLLNTQQYLAIRRQAFHNDGLLVPSIINSPNDANYDINGLWDTTRYTDWQKVLLGRTAVYTDLNANVSGGTANTQFMVGATYHREGTVFPSSFSDQKGAMHFNFQHSSENKKFVMSLTGNYLYDQNQLPSSDLTLTALNMAPDAPSLYNSDGSLNWATNGAGNSTWLNPLASYQVFSLLKTNNLLGSLSIGYHLLPNLEIKTDLSYNHIEQNESYELPLTSLAPENRTSNSSRGSLFQHADVNTWNMEPQIVYHRGIGSGKLEGLAGIQVLQTNSFGQYILATGFTSDLLLGDVGSASSFSAKTITPAIYKYAAGFGRLTYNWQDTYILDVNARRDGSSRFGPENRFHDFWSIGGAWIFSQTQVAKQNLSWLSFGKLSSSYGTTGNDQLPNYQYLNTYGSISVSTPYQSISGLRPNGLTNPYLQWEETRKLNARVDLGFFQDRILLSTDYFHYRSSNQLLSYNLSLVAGFNTIQANFPATVQNSGWELALKTVNLKDKNFNWSTSITLTIPRNKLVAFSNLAGSSYASRLIIGQSVNIGFNPRFLGIDPATGIYRVANVQGIPTSSPVLPADYTIIEKFDPNYYGGVQNTFFWKGLMLDFTFYFLKTYRVSNPYGTIGSGVPGRFSSNSTPPTGNIPAFLLKNIWQHPGDVATIQRLSTINLATALSSSVVFTDGSYVRLKNVSLSYQLPQTWAKRAGMQNCRIYANGQNLLTIAKFMGLDPESGTSGLPPLRVITLGIQASF